MFAQIRFTTEPSAMGLTQHEMEARRRSRVELEQLAALFVADEGVITFEMEVWETPEGVGGAPVFTAHRCPRCH